MVYIQDKIGEYHAVVSFLYQPATSADIHAHSKLQNRVLKLDVATNSHSVIEVRLRVLQSTKTERPKRQQKKRLQDSQQEDEDCSKSNLNQTHTQLFILLQSSTACLLAITCPSSCLQI